MVTLFCKPLKPNKCKFSERLGTKLRQAYNTNFTNKTIKSFLPISQSSGFKGSDNTAPKHASKKKLKIYEI